MKTSYATKVNKRINRSHFQFEQVDDDNAGYATIQTSVSKRTTCYKFLFKRSERIQINRNMLIN